MTYYAIVSKPTSPKTSVTITDSLIKFNVCRLLRSKINLFCFIGL